MKLVAFRSENRWLAFRPIILAEDQRPAVRGSGGVMSDSLNFNDGLGFEAKFDGSV